MKLRTLSLCALALCAAALAAGCQRESGDTQHPNPAHRKKAPVAAQRGPTAAELTAGMVEAATQGKSQAPVGLNSTFCAGPCRANRWKSPSHCFPASRRIPRTVELSAPEGLQVPAADSKFEFASVEPDQVYRRSIRLTPTAEGVFLLTLTVNLKHDQMADTRVFSVPIIVAGSAAAAPASSGNPPPTPAASPTG